MKYFRSATVLLALALITACQRQQPLEIAKSKIRIGVSPFQDTLLPVIGQDQNWYATEGLDVEFKILGWSQVMEALSAGSVDLAINNISSIVATHSRNQNLVYYYGLNPFDNGFALMIRPNGPLKTLTEIRKSVPDLREAIRLTAEQLRGRVVITTSNTDMEQGVAAAAHRGGLNFVRDLRIISLNPDEGLAAFLRGEGDAYIGGIPQRTRAAQEGMLEMLTGSDFGPPPINGFVTSRKYMQEHPETLLKVLHVWFRCVRFVDHDKDKGAEIIIRTLNRYSAANFTVEDFKRYWNNYEHYPANPQEVQELILNLNGRNYWKLRWDDCNSFFFDVKHTIPVRVDPDGVFVMPEVHAAYIKKFGNE